MKVIKGGSKEKFKDTVLTLGNFDGLHLGHQRILKAVSRRASELGLKSVVYTFDPHPLKVVAPEKSPPLIMTLPEKIRLIEGFEIDYLVVADFTKKLAQKDPREFVSEVLVDALSVKEVIVGHDYAFGKGKRGTISELKRLGVEFGFKTEVIEAYKLGGHIVSSSRVRREIKAGRPGAAKRLLGRGFSVTGKVIRGKDIGRALGFPTANIAPKTELRPAEGVYAVRAEIDNKNYNGVANIGRAPTFGAKELTIEVHLFRLNADLYNKPMTVEFVRRLRDEKTFKNKEALTTQIKKDIARAKRLL
jgi:riboflavin kinase/FMN adenylyltransferase